MSGITIVEEVTRLEENATIGPSKLELPADVVFTEVTIPGK